MAEADKCFVVMPFGVKPKNDGTGATYDFDKVYRVIIQRAIRNVSMQALRADETEGNRVIHADMFKDLRDRPVVIVDLSLLNPNVFYELGIRHVMSPTGTVLMANEETVKKLPFDIALSRTISYKYDGHNMDWDEVERVVPQLQAAIEEARRGAPDSPIYAFLEQVLSPSALKKDDTPSNDPGNSSTDLDRYEEEFAVIWKAQNKQLDELIEEHANSPFGIRAIGYLGCRENFDLNTKVKIARLLFNHEQYDLATKLYEQADDLGDLEFFDIINHASAVSNTFADPLEGAKRGLRLVERARTMAKKRLDENPNDKDALADISYATQCYAAMLAWIWQITKDDKDITPVLTELREAIRLIEDLRSRDIPVPSGRYALNLLRYTMFLRIAENDRERSDLEKNFQKILSLKVLPPEDRALPDPVKYTSASYVRWYQVFVLADMGKYDDAQKRAMEAIAEDIKYANREEETEVGRRQYSELRQLLELFSRYWRDTKSIARVSQILNTAHIR